MPGYRGSNRVPGGDARTRRNWNSNATAYSTRTLGDGLTLATNRTLSVDISATGGLEFVSGALEIKYPADGGVKTGTDGLEVDISGMAANTDPAEADLVIIEDSGGTDAKEKTTIAQLRATLEQPWTISTQTDTYTMLTTDHVVLANKATAFTITLPAAADLTGQHYYIKSIGVGAVTVDGASAETIDDVATVVLNQYESITIVSDGSEWWII